MPKKVSLKFNKKIYTIAKFIDSKFTAIWRWRRKYFQWVAAYTNEKQKKRKYVIMGERNVAIEDKKRARM